MKKLGIFLILVSVVLFILTGVFASKSADKYSNYIHVEDDVTINRNAYVKGDAYNYIINGTYFTGFAVYAAACGIGGLLAFIFGAFMVSLHDKMDIIALKAARSALDVARENITPDKK